MRRLTDNALRQFYSQDIKPTSGMLTQNVVDIVRPDLWRQMNSYERLGRSLWLVVTLLVLILCGCILMGMLFWLFLVAKTAVLWAIKQMAVR
jgi:hypothetical protein